jgi:hypothetical protein
MQRHEMVNIDETIPYLLPNLFYIVMSASKVET